MDYLFGQLLHRFPFLYFLQQVFLHFSGENALFDHNIGSGI